MNNYLLKKVFLSLQDGSDDSFLAWLDKDMTAHPLNLVINYRPLSEITPDVRNARTHSQRQVDQIAASIQEFGFTNPVLVDEDGVLIAGHGRLRAAKQIKMATVPTVVLPHLSEAQKRALRLADNKIAQNAGWDMDLLKGELEALSALELSFDLEVIGFSAGEIDVVFAGQSAGDPDDEVIPAAPVNPRSKQGDIWVLGPHRVGCGDCRDHDFLQRVMGPNAVADAAFLDPPYNVKIDGHANVKSHHREFAMASGEMSDQAFVAFLEQTLGACANASRSGAVHFVCMDWRHLDHLQRAGDKTYGAWLNLCVWNKSNAGMGALYRSKHELILVYRVGDAAHFNAVELGRHGRNRTNVWDYPSVNGLRGSRREDLQMHPTVKPVGMIADAIKDVTHRGDVVLDTFLGSGTTLIACERAGRQCRGVEIDPAYVDVAIERWSAMTGIEPRLEQPHCIGGKR
jgi:DNA modification methylase